MELEIEEISKHWKEATEGLAGWRTEARESYDFAAGDQWDEESKAKLEEEERPAVTFDRIGVFIDAVCGMEVNNRQMIKYFPVEAGDVHVNDVLSQSVKYFENDCGAEDEDSEASRDAIVCGIGVTETVLSTDIHPDGAPCVIRRDPLNVWFDPKATKRNLSDRRYQFHGDWMDEAEARLRWPDGSFSGDMPSNARMSTNHIADKAFEYRENAEVDDKRENQVFILHYQCFKKVDNYRLRDPNTGEITDFSKSQFTAAKKMFAGQFGREPALATEKSPSGDYIKTTKKVFYRAFLSGGDILEQNVLKVADFTFKFITFKRDRNKRRWYGLVRSLKDPQRWANKWLSQILHIVNTNAKGGAFVETGALVDPKNAEELWAKANPLILLKEGGIDKIRERGQSSYPNGLDRLMQFAFNALPMVSGINLEVLGLADREQAGVVESQRRQSAFTILAPLFAAIREYRKARGRLMLAFMKFVPQGTLVKINGKAGEQWVPLVYEDTTYDVRIDQAPDSPDYKKQVWESLGQILPAMMKAGYPIPPEILTFSPLPTSVSEQWVAWIKEQGWMPPEQKAQMEQMGQQIKTLSQKTMQLTEENMMLRLDHTVDMTKLQLKSEESENKNEVKLYQANLTAMTEKVNSSIEAQKNAVESALKAEQQKFEQQMRALEAISTEKMEGLKLELKTFETVIKANESAAKSMEEKAEQRSRRKMNVKRLKDGVYQIEPE